MDNRELWELETWLRSRLSVALSTYVLQAYYRGLPRHLVVHAVESEVNAILSRLRELDNERRALGVTSDGSDSGARNPLRKRGELG